MRFLFCGNTDYLSEKSLSAAFPEDRILLWSEAKPSMAKAENVRVIRTKEGRKNYSDVLRSGDVDAVVYLSGMLTPGVEMEREMSSISQLLSAVNESRQPRFIYVRLSPKVMAHGEGTSIVYEAIERLCRSSLNEGGLYIINSPYLYNAGGGDPFFTPLFHTLGEERFADLPLMKDAAVPFLAADDLIALLSTVCRETENAGREVLSLKAAASVTGQQLCEWITAQLPGTRLQPLEGRGDDAQEDGDGFVRETYGWFARYRLENDLPKMIHSEGIGEKRQLFAGLRARLASAPKAVRTALELAGAACIAEICARLSANHVQFSMVDFRLLFVVLMGSVYGMRMGIAAAFAASVMLFFAYQSGGRNGMMLFYEPSNWIAFIAYIAAGAACGFARMVSADKIRMLKKQNDALRDKYVFLHGLYEEGEEERRAYKKQILSTKDSFSRVFDVAQRLSVEDKTQVYGQAIFALEELLENETIAIYSIGRNPYFARLEACSRSVRGQEKASIRLEDYPEMVAQIRDGGVYVNKDLQKGFPAYAMGICDDGALRLIVLLGSASAEQMSMYYMNLFRMVGEQIRVALTRAIRYDAILQDKRYYKGTIVMRPEAFKQIVESFRQNANADLTEGIVLRLNCGEAQMNEASQKLGTIIRENDVVGMGRDGHLYLLLRQINMKNVSIVTERITRVSGLDCEIVSLDMPETQNGL